MNPAKKYPVIACGYGVFIAPNGGYIFPYKDENGVNRPLPPCKTLNVQACTILEQCAGHTPVEDIVHTLEKMFENTPSDLFSKVKTFLDETVQEGYVLYSDTPVKMEGLLQGSLDYYVPSQVLFEATTRCNLMCKHCLLSAGKPLPDELETEEILPILERLYEIGVKRLMLSGGEVLTKKGWKTLVDFCADRFYFAFLTNGTLITEETADILAHCREVHISLYGKDAETHEKVTGVEGSFEKSLKGIQFLKERGVYCGVSALMVPFNVHQLEDIVQLAISLQCDIVRVGAVCPIGRACDGQWELTEKQRELLEKKMDELQKQYTIAIQWEEEKSEEKSCGAGYTRWVITSNGDVYPCGVLRIPIGNVAKDDPVTVCTSPAVKFLQTLKAPSCRLCSNCCLLVTCKGCHQEAFFHSFQVDHCHWMDQVENAPEPLKSALSELHKKKKNEYRH